MKLTEVTSYNLKSQTILNESWDMLTESQRLHIGAWEKNVWPLMEQLNALFEAELTADQIQQVFANAEKISIEGGKNMTALGKGAKVTAEVSGKIKAEIEKLIKQAANSEPVKNMDQQFDKLRTELANKLKTMKGGDKILAGVDKWKQFATKNPGKSTFIIAAMTSLLAFASGGMMSGAAIGFFLKLANNTIKGDKLSTAIGKGVKGAALGAVAGALGDAIGGDEIEIAKAATQDAPAPISAEITADEVVDSAGVDDAAEVADSLPDLQSAKDAYAERIAEVIGQGDVPYEMIEKISDTLIVEGDYPNGEWSMKLPEGSAMVRGEIFLTPDEAAAWDQFRQGKDIGQVLGKEGTDWLKANVEGAEEMISADEAEAAAQAAEIEKDNILPADEVDALSDKELSTRMAELKASPEFDPDGDSDVSREYRQLNRELNSRKWDFGYDYGDRNPLIDDIEESLWQEFELYQQSLNEGPLGTAAKNFAKSVGGVAAAGAKAVGSGIAGAAKKGAAAVGKEVSQKITVRKLNKMWKDAGSPTDTGSIANILAQAGMDDEQIGLVSTDSKVDLKPTAGASTATGDAGASTSTGTVDIKSLADEIKKAGPEIVSAVKTMLTAKPAAKPVAKPVAKPKYAAPPAQPKAAPAAPAA